MATTHYLIHLTDTHLKAPQQKPFLNVDAAAKLRAVFAQVKTLSIAPSCFIISGDLTHEGDTDDYRYLRQLLGEELSAFNVPALVALGNHDHRAAFREGFLGEAASEAPYYYSTQLGGLRVIVLDSQIEIDDKVEGRLDAAQLAWLGDQLTRPAPDGTLLVLHHPPHPNTHPLLQSHLLTNASALADVIAGTDVIGVLSGHIHFNSIALFAGVPSAAGMGIAFNLDPSTARSMRFIDSAGYNLVMVREGQMIVQPMPLPGAHAELYHWHIDGSLDHMAEGREALPSQLK